MTTEIQCRCGAVHLELNGEPVAQFFCHCDDCQLVHGGAYKDLPAQWGGSGEPVGW